MKRIFSLVLFIFLFLLVSSAKASQKIRDLPQLYAKYSRAVVLIKVDFKHINSSSGLEEGNSTTGTGVFITSDGLILSTDHLIRNPDLSGAKMWRFHSVTVFHNNLSYKAKILSDNSRGISFVAIENPNRKFPMVRIANLKEPKPGQPIFTIGNSLRLYNNLKFGIISAIVDSKFVDSGGARFIISSLGVTSGDSGGPVFDKYGRLIGINIFFFPSAPTISGSVLLDDYIAKVIKKEIADFKNHKELSIERANFPVVAESLEDWEKNLSQISLTRRMEFYRIWSVNHGVLVIESRLSVINENDIILSIDGQTVTNFLQLIRKVDSAKFGQKLEFGIWRDGKPIRVTYILASEKLIPTSL